MEMEFRSSIFINKSAEVIFNLLSALDLMNDWMPTSAAYLGTDLTSELPVRKGSTYTCRSPQGNRAGVVETFDPPNHLVFTETTKNSSIRIEYNFSPSKSGTILERHVVITGPIMKMILFKALRSKFVAGNKFVLQGIKHESERN